MINSRTERKNLQSDAGKNLSNNRWKDTKRLAGATSLMHSTTTAESGINRTGPVVFTCAKTVLAKNARHSPLVCVVKPTLSRLGSAMRKAPRRSCGIHSRSWNILAWSQGGRAMLRLPWPSLGLCCVEWKARQSVAHIILEPVLGRPSVEEFF